MLNVVDVSVYLDRLRPFGTEKPFSWREGQKEAIIDMLQGLSDYQDTNTGSHQVLELKAPTASGKCLGKGTPVIMFDGSIKPVEAIEEGALLMGPDSKPRKVLSTTTGRGQLYKIKPLRGDSFICNGAHILNLRCVHTEYNYVRDATLNISVDNYIKKSNNFKHLWKLWRTGVEYPTHDVPFDPYITGVWLGDGTRRVPAITNPDVEVLTAIREFAATNGYGITESVRNGCTHCYITSVKKGNGAPLMDFIKTMYINGEKRIPEEYLINDRNVRMQILAGLIDTDGYKYKDRNGYQIVTKYFGLANDILNLARSLGLSANCHEITKCIKATGFKGEYYNINIGVGHNQIPCKIYRKKCAESDHPMMNVGFDVESIGEGDYFGFQLDGDHLFLLGDFTVSHNSAIIYAFAKAAINFKLLDRIVVTTPQRVLVDQYAKEKGWFDVIGSDGRNRGPGIVLGRANYVCSLDPECMADACCCKSPGERKKHPECGNCEYEKAKTLFKEAQIALTTLAYYTIGYSPVSQREGMVIDESSGLEANLLERYSLKIPSLKEYDEMDLNDPDELKEMVDDYLPNLVRKSEALNEELKELADGSNSDRKKKIAKELRFYDSEINKCQNINSFLERGEKYYVEKEMKISPRDARQRGQPENEKTMIRKFKLVMGKTLFARFTSTPEEREKAAKVKSQCDILATRGEWDQLKEFKKSHKGVGNKVNFIILASGTPTTRLLTKDFSVVEMKHPIPVDRRACLVLPVGSMAMKSRYTTIPKIAKSIAELHEKIGKGKHTIVHCHSYDIAHDIGNILMDLTSSNVVIQKREKVEAVSREIYKNKWIDTKDCIFLSVAWAEGLDLKGPEYPLNLIVKVPFSYYGSGWVKLRDACDGGEFNTCAAAVELMQAAGRTTRDPKDFSTTYILDSDFMWWQNRNARFLESWFKESVKKVSA